MNAKHVFIGPYAEPSAGELRFAIKDNIDIAGLYTTAGSRALGPLPPASADAAVITAIRRSSNHHIVGKTNLDEFAAGATGLNPWFGNVANPIDAARMIGGSSSGSAAAVALGLADIGIGTDTGGSVRIPAALCGVHGLKPTNGLVSTRGVYPLSQTLDTVGPIAATVQHVRQGLAAMLPLTAPPTAEIELRELRVGRIRFDTAETAVDRTIDDLLAHAGVVTRDIVLDGWGEARDVAYEILAIEAWQNNQVHVDASPELIGEHARRLFMTGAETTLQEYGRALRFKRSWSELIERQFDECDVLICPTLASLAPRTEDIEGLDWQHFSRTIQFNLSGHPAFSLSLPVSGSAFTAGMQIIGAFGSDFRLIDTAQRFEQLIQP